MRDIIVAALVIVGSLFIVLGAIGIMRMPDLYTRMHAATKPVILGGGLLLAGAAVWFQQLGVTTRAGLIVFLLLLTVPLGAHVIGRAAYFSGAKLWSGTVRDDLRGQYDLRSHKLGNVLTNPGGGNRPHGPDVPVDLVK